MQLGGSVESDVQDDKVRADKNQNDTFGITTPQTIYSSSEPSNDSLFHFRCPMQGNGGNKH